MRYVINEYMTHYMRERFHQGLGGKLVDEKSPTANDNNASATVTCRSRLGGLLNYYERDAA